MRASVIQGNLVDLERLGPLVVQQVRDQLDPGVVLSIERASRIAWLPLQHDLALSAAVEQVVGRGEHVEWARTSMLRSLRTPLLEPLWRAAFRVFGMSPGALFRAVPSGWGPVYRNVGSVEHISRRSAATLVVSDLPDVLLADLSYLEGMCGTFTALLKIANVPGTVELSDIRPRQQTIEYAARWGEALET